MNDWELYKQFLIGDVNMRFDEMVDKLGEDTINQMRKELAEKGYKYNLIERDTKIQLVADYTKERAIEAIKEVNAPWQLIAEVAFFSFG